MFPIVFIYLALLKCQGLWPFFSVLLFCYCVGPNALLLEGFFYIVFVMWAKVIFFFNFDDQFAFCASILVNPFHVYLKFRKKAKEQK